MKLRYTDFLSEEEYRSLRARDVDRHMYIAGIGCLVAMLACCICFMVF